MPGMACAGLNLTCVYWIFTFWMDSAWITRHRPLAGGWRSSQGGQVQTTERYLGCTQRIASAVRPDRNRTRTLGARPPFYIGPDNRLMSAEAISEQANWNWAPCARCSDRCRHQYDVSPDGLRFLALMPNEQAAPEPLMLVQNWTAGLKK
jgi:hypothetical protein